MVHQKNILKLKYQLSHNAKYCISYKAKKIFQIIYNFNQPIIYKDKKSKKTTDGFESEEPRQLNSAHQKHTQLPNPFILLHTNFLYVDQTRTASFLLNRPVHHSP